MMNQLKSIYNNPFKNSHSHPIHTCLAIIASNGSFGQNFCQIIVFLLQTQGLAPLRLGFPGSATGLISRIDVIIMYL